MLDNLIRVLAVILSAYIVVLWLIRGSNLIAKIFAIVILPLGFFGWMTFRSFYIDVLREVEHPSTSTLYNLLTHGQGLYIYGSSFERIYLGLKGKIDDVILSFRLEYIHKVINAAALIGKRELFASTFRYAVMADNHPSEWKDDIAQLSRIARFDPNTVDKRALILNRMLKYPLGRNHLKHKALAMMDLGDAITDLLRFNSSFPGHLFNNWIDLSGHWLENYGFLGTMGLSTTLGDLDDAQIKMATDKYQKAIKIFMELGLSKDASFAWNAIGDLLSIQEKYNESLQAYSESLKLSSELVGCQDFQSFVTNKIATIFVLAKNFLFAEQYFFQSLKLLEEFYGDIVSVNEKKIQSTGLFILASNGIASISRCFTTDALTSAQRDHIIRNLFHYLDTQRGRNATEFARFPPIIHPGNLMGDIVRQEQVLLKKLRINHVDSIDTLFVPGKTGGEVRQNLMGQLNDLWERIKIDCGVSGARYKKIKNDSPFELEDLSEIFQFLPKKTGILYTKVLPDCIIVLMIISQPFKTQYWKIDIDIKSLKRRYIQDYFEETMKSDGTPSFGGWRDLGKLLLNNVVDQLQNLDLLYIVPDKEVEKIPFHAMWVGEQGAALIDLCPVVYTSSIRLLNQIVHREQQQYTNIPLVIGSSRPQQSTEESITERVLIEGNARVAARILGTNHIYLGDNASGFAMQHGQDVPVLHIACHGSDDIHKPGIMIGNSRFSVREIMTMNFNNDLVFLSVCMSRYPEVGNLVSEYVDVTEAFLCSGARSTVSALWSIPAHSTQYFVSCFYQHLIRPVPDGIQYLGDPAEMWAQDSWIESHPPVSNQDYRVSKAKALQLAMYDVRSKYPDFRDWAGFVLNGCFD